LADTTFINCEFDSNTSQDGGSIVTKGVVTITDSIFTGSTAASTGGVMNSAINSNVTIKRSTFINNSAISGSAVYASGVLHVTGCNFSNHTAAVSGAAIYSDTTGTATIEESVFTSGTAPTGAAIYLQSTASIIDCVLSNNKATTSGGAVHCDDCILLTTNSNYTDNAVLNGDGGALYIQGNATVNACRFTANDAIAHGGAILNSENSTTTIIATHFILNVAGRAGAAVFSDGSFTSNRSVVFSSDTTFQNSSATCCYAAGYGMSSTQQQHAIISGRNVLTATPAAVYSCEDIDSGGERGAECCIPGQFSDSLQCIACDSNIYNCTTTGVTVATLPLKQGYWRVNLETQAVLECWEPSACNGGAANTSVNDYCADGYTGPCKYFLYTLPKSLFV
jgi:predicted outer membrane repeat protein